MTDLTQYLSNNTYPGRGILLGRNGSRAVIAYFIMGRSQNSRNRIFIAEGDGLRTQAYDPAKLEDPSLIIYAPVRMYGNALIVTNGDQTDTIYDFLVAGKSFEQALATREFEPDMPNYTPRISGLLALQGDNFTYRLSILKRADSGACERLYFDYPAPQDGVAHIIHTYSCDGVPLPSFTGAPVEISISGEIDAFTQSLWSALDEQNRVSLFVRYLDPRTGTYEDRIINRHCQ